MEAKSKTCAKEVFRNASVSTNTNLATSDVASEDALEAGADKSTPRSPFFENYAGDATQAERQGGVARASSGTPLSPAEKAETVDLTLPAKPALELEPSQSQGSHVNGVAV